MPHRSHLFSLRIANALRESLKESPYTAQRFGKDIIAGITVGIIAIPLSMALAIASGWVAAGAALVKDIAELVVPWYSTLSVTVAVTVPLPSAVGV